MIVEVVWMDGEDRLFKDVDSYGVGTDQVLRLYGRDSRTAAGGLPAGNLSPGLLAELPTYHIREIRRIG